MVVVEAQAVDVALSEEFLQSLGALSRNEIPPFAIPLYVHPTTGVEIPTVYKIDSVIAAELSPGGQVPTIHDLELYLEQHHAKKLRIYTFPNHPDAQLRWNHYLVTAKQYKSLQRVAQKLVEEEQSWFPHHLYSPPQTFQDAPRRNIVLQTLNSWFDNLITDDRIKPKHVAQSITSNRPDFHATMAGFGDPAGSSRIVQDLVQASNDWAASYVPLRKFLAEHPDQIPNNIAQDRPASSTTSTTPGTSDRNGASSSTTNRPWWKSIPL